MPPAPTGVADYAARLVRILRTRGSIELWPARADVNLYQLGNNQLHAPVYRRALEQPGVIVLHDAVMHHFALGYLGRDEYIEEFVFNYGEWHRSTASVLWSGRVLSASDSRYFRYAMIRRVVELSRAVVVHNPAAARVVREHSPDVPVCEIPHLYIPREQPHAADVYALRSRLGFGAGEFVCGIFGHLRASKRIESVARACGMAGVGLLIAGACPEDLERGLEPVFRLPFVRRAPYTDPETFHCLIHTVDACANLRYPAAAETSGIGIELMGAGKPVIMTDGEEIARYPEACCLRIEHGPGETEALAHILVWLKERRSDARSIGARAANYLRVQHSPERVADLYWKALRQ
jgi:hypothetical protein